MDAVPAFRRQLLEGEKFELVLDLLHGENYNTMLSVLCTLRNVSLQGEQAFAHGFSLLHSASLTACAVTHVGTLV